MSALAGLRDDRQHSVVATAAAVVLGLVLSSLHWSGLLVAGALVALPQRSFRRGVAAGVAMGGLVLVAFLARLALAGTLGPTLAMGQPSWLALGFGLGLPAFGSLLRGLL